MPSSFSPPRLGAIVLAGSLLLASSAAAQKLVEIGQTSVGTPVFLEAKSITRRDGIVTAAVLKLYPAPKARATALAALPEANLALISVPGEFAPAEARRAARSIFPRRRAVG